MVPEGPNSQNPPEGQTGNTTITVLSVSPTQDDHDTLERLLSGLKWKIHAKSGLSSAMALLKKTCIPLIICERDLEPGTWRDMLDCLTPFPQRPYLIVTSRFADDHLWAEALNIGAYNVLAKPFDRTELKRILNSAWRHWHDQADAAMRSRKTVSATVRGAVG